MKLDGFLENAQLEELATDAPVSGIARSRIFSDITDNANPIPRFYDSSKWVPLKLRKLQYGPASAVITLSKNMEAYLFDASGGAFTATLPAAATMTGQEFFLKKTDATFTAVTVKGNGAELIDGSNTTLLSTKGEWIRLLCTGTAWTVLEGGYFRGKTAFVPAGSWVANATYTGFWWREGNRLNFDFKVALGGAPTATQLNFDLPGTLSLDAAQNTAPNAGTTMFSGGVMCYDSSATDNFLGYAVYHTATNIQLVKDDGDGTVSALNATAPVTFAIGDIVQGTVKDLPISGWRG